VDRLVVNGVDVTEFVNQHDPWYPLRTALHVTSPAEMRDAWGLLTKAWATTVVRAQRLPGRAPHQRVGGEWSFIETLRHLLLATDKWFTLPVLGGSFHPFGLADAGSVDFPWPGIDRTADPSLAEVLDARADRVGHIAQYLATVTDADLTRTVDVLENGPTPCASASPPCSKKSSGTSATPPATSPASKLPATPERSWRGQDPTGGVKPTAGRVRRRGWRRAPG